MLKRGTLVEVHWLDAEADGAWTPIRDVLADYDPPPTVRSVGYVLADNEQGLIIAGDVGTKLEDDQHVNRPMVIPKACVQKVRRLK